MANNVKETTIEIKDVLAVILRRRWLLIAPFILVTVISLAGSFLMDKKYQSSTMVVIEQTQYLSKQLQAMVPGQEETRFSDIQRKNFLIAIQNEIISSAYLQRLIDELNLGQDPSVVRKAQKLNAQRPDVPVTALVYRILIEELRKNIQVDFNGENVVQITSESSDPAMAMKIATRLAEIFKDERLKREMSGVRGALDFSDEQLSIYRKNLDEAERRKAQFASEYIQNQLDESVSADTNIRAIMADVDNIKLQLDENIRQQTAARTALSSYRLEQLTLAPNDEYNRLRTDINAETQRLVDFMSKYTWSDPKVINAGLKISRDLQDLEKVIGQLVERQFSSASAADKKQLTIFFSLQAREMAFREKLNSFQVALSTLRSRIAYAPQFEIKMRNLENEVNSARQVYEKFQSQLTGSEISQSLMRGESESKYRIMEPASVPLRPVKPNRVKITILGAILGLVIGGAAAVMAELLDNSFKKIEEVESFLGMPVLAAIPAIASIKGKVKVN
jgi:succinoglycan biosynthesis transport protein ExoP